MWQEQEKRRPHLRSGLGWALGVTRSPIRTKPEREAEAAADSVLKGAKQRHKSPQPGAPPTTHQGTQGPPGRGTLFNKHYVRESISAT